MASALSIPGASNNAPPTHPAAAAAETNTMAPASDATKAHPNFRETHHGKVALKKLSYLKNRNLHTEMEEDYVNRLAAFLFIPAIREGVKKAKHGASGKDILKEIYKHIAASKQFQDALSENDILDTDTVADTVVNTEVHNKVEDAQIHNVSDLIYFLEDCPTPARHPDEPTTEPEELELSPLVDVVKIVADKQPSPSRIPVLESPRVEFTFEAPRTPKREESEGSPVSKFRVLKCTAWKEPDALEQYHAEKLSKESMPVQNAQKTAETVTQKEVAEVPPKEATAKKKSTAMPREPLNGTTNMAGNGRQFALQTRVTKGTGLPKRIVKKNDTARDRAWSKIDAEEESASEDEHMSQPKKDSEAEEKKASKPEPKREKKETVEKGETTRLKDAAMSVFQDINSFDEKEAPTKEKPAAASNKRKREDVRNSTPRTPAKSAASKRTQATKRRVSKEPAFVADESESEDEQPAQKRKKVNCKNTVKSKEDRLPIKKNRKAPKLNIKGPIVAEIKSNDFLKAHAHLSFQEKITAALTYNNTHTSIRTDPALLQQDDKKRKRSQDDWNEENESIPVPKKLNTGGKGPVPEKKKRNSREVLSDAQLHAPARKNNTIKGTIGNIEKSSK